MFDWAKALAQLGDESTPPGELVHLIDEIEFKCTDIADIPAFERTGHAPEVKEFFACSGISTLVHVAMTGWPTDGNLTASQHPYDAVVDAGAAGVPHEVDATTAMEGIQEGAPRWRSARRKAIMCLADLAHLKPYLDKIARSGLFAADALPAMLEASFGRIDFAVHNKGFSFYHARDQTPTVAWSLLNLAASGTIGRHEPLLETCRKQTGMAVCKLWKDPFQLWVDKCHAERQALAARHRNRGWSEERIMDAVHALKERQQKREDGPRTESAWAGKDFFVLGALDYNVVRFFKALMMGCTEDELLQLIHQGGLITLLKGCVNPAAPRMMMDPSGPEPLINVLTMLWTKKAAEVSKDLYKCIQEQEAQADGLRQQGNDAFKAGQYQQAINCYWQAVSHNPQDYALFNNISLAALKMGDIKEALTAAQESIRVSPTVYKSWVRLGDAYKAIKRWQLAHLAYSCARELAPNDADARQEEVQEYLEEVWSIDDVPRFGHEAPGGDPVGSMSSMLTAFKFMGISKEPRQMMAMVMDDKGDSLEKTLTKLDGQTRYIACSQLRGDIDDARAMAVASGMLRPSSLPRSCAHLKKPEQLQPLMEEWSISWTDMPMRHKKSGLPRHVLSVASGSTGMMKGSLITLGTPGLHSVRRVLLQAMLSPQDGRPGRPLALFVANRMFPLVHKMDEMIRPWGIRIAAETASESIQTCKNQDTDPEGLNNRGDYRKEDETYGLFKKKAVKDPNNGHKKT